MWDECKKCCGNCCYFEIDRSVNSIWCEKEDGEWVEQESENYWSPDNDYCTSFEQIKY